MGVERGSAGQEFSGEDKGPSHCDTTVSIRSLRTKPCPSRIFLDVVGRRGVQVSSNYGEISRTATGDAPLPRIGCPAASPQPARLMMVVFTLPVAGAAMLSGFRNSWTKPTICTLPVADLNVPMSNTGTVTSEL